MESLIAWDIAVLMSLNQYVGDVGFIDVLIRLVNRNNVIKGVPMMMLFWGLWFASDRIGPRTRERLAALLIISITAILAGRVLQVVLPFRLRPMHDPQLDVKLPAGLSNENLDGWSSMPSDHAVLFFALAFGFLLVNRWVGLMALAHASIIVCLPRVYLGLHFPSDILAGAVIGGGFALVIMPSLARWLEERQLVAVGLRYPFLLYPLMFAITLESATLYGGSRDIVDVLTRLAVGFLTQGNRVSELVTSG